MALNYSHRPIFPAHVAEDSLVSPVRIVNGCLVEGVPDKNGEGYLRPWHASRGGAEEWNFNCGRDRVDCCSSPESTSKDIVDLLPSDPFGMDIETTVTAITAITGWLEDLKVDWRRDNGTTSPKEYGLFAGWNFIWNNAIEFRQFPSNIQFSENLHWGGLSVPSNFQERMGIQSCSSSPEFVEKSNEVIKTNQFGEDTVMGGVLAPYEFGFEPTRNMGDIVGFGNVSTSTSCSSELQFGGKVEGASNFEGVPHEAFTFALSYLGVKDLLSVEMVCKSLCSTVRGDPLLWMSIHIDQPLKDRITNDVLVQLANRAQGNLQCLSIVECTRVTDDGLRRVLETNPRITKLCVPGCTRLSVEGILNNIKMYKSDKDARGIKNVRIGGIYGVTSKHFDELKSLLGVDMLESPLKPHFFHRGNFYLPYDDDRAIDIEMCPRCEKFRLVYDCPAEGCQVKDKDKAAAEVCRGCTLCIARCHQCGRCINNTEYEETFTFELVCLVCSKQPLKYQDKLDEKGDPCGAINEASYCFSPHG